ncbi:hypothetical protein C4D60_Mb07t10050 [Musa balbisiana]|uniref:Uncharacterized protein n=1 Tax=Musa balbisiana TaxID=52838 RepID=A0A4S8JEF7_MUSBA|nr:hypothetical protein C4D60_Mb07t10050 [Musa balbisiana]
MRGRRYPAVCSSLTGVPSVDKQGILYVSSRIFSSASGFYLLVGFVSLALLSSLLSRFYYPFVEEFGKGLLDDIEGLVWVPSILGRCPLISSRNRTMVNSKIGSSSSMRFTGKPNQATRRVNQYTVVFQQFSYLLDFAGGASSGKARGRARRRREQREGSREARAAGRLAGGLAGGASSERARGRREGSREARAAAARATTVGARATSSDRDRERQRQRQRQQALARSAQRLGSGERPGGACLKRAAWDISEALGPRLASPERLGERPSAFLNHWKKLLYMHPSTYTPMAAYAVRRIVPYRRFDQGSVRYGTGVPSGTP